MSDRDIRYCTTEDGASIAYSVRGDGPPLVMTPFLMESFTLEEISPAYHAFSERLARSVRLIQYDLRGTGSSTRSTVADKLESFTYDLEAVVHAVGVSKVSVFGRAVGCTPAMHLAARRREIVDRLILLAPAARTADVIATEETSGMIQLCRGNWGLASRMLADLSSREEFGDKALKNAEWYRKSTSGEVMARLIEIYSQERVTNEELSRIACPTLILQPTDDSRWTPEAGQRVAALIPGASFRLLAGGLHTFALGDAEPVLQALADFLGIAASTPTADSTSVRTVLFTDLVGHTEMMSRSATSAGARCCASTNESPAKS